MKQNEQKHSSRLSGFYKLPIQARIQKAAAFAGLEAEELVAIAADGGMSPEIADKTVENVIGVYALPLALGLNVRMNGKDFLAPMVVEEPSVIAAASHASKLVREGGGFEAEADEPVMIAQVLLHHVKDAAFATRQILEARDEILARTDRAVPGLVRRGGGGRDVQVRMLGDGMLAVHILVDCRDAMGANLVNTVAESMAAYLAKLAEGKVGLRILSNLADERCVRVTCRVPVSALAFEGYEGREVAEGIEQASRFAEADPYRAATHNKGIMNGIDPVVIATGNDWRAVEAGAHAYAARKGRYSPLCTWRVEADQLVGRLALPMALGIVGGPSRVHPAVQMNLKLAGCQSAQELGMLAACVGVASNLAALRALATDGIQRGHMALHARSVAMAAGATEEWVERVAEEIHALGEVTLEAAQRAIRRLNTQAKRKNEPMAIMADR